MVLEFDHVPGRGKKVGNVGDLAKYGSWPKALREIAKCDIVCANCHRIRTHTRAGDYRTAIGRQVLFGFA